MPFNYNIQDFDLSPRLLGIQKRMTIILYDIGDRKRWINYSNQQDFQWDCAICDALNNNAVDNEYIKIEI